MNNNGRIGEPGDLELTGTLHVAVKHILNEPPPEQAIARALERVQAIGDPINLRGINEGVGGEHGLERRRVGGRNGEEPVPPVIWSASGRRNQAGRRQWMLRFRITAATAIAASLAIAVFLWMDHVSPVWADVMHALQQRAWVHVTEIGPDGEQLELWLSPTQQIEAVRRGKVVQIFDQRLMIVHSYNPDEQTIYRMPYTQRHPTGPYLSAVDAIPAIIGPGGDRPANELDASAKCGKLAFMTDESGGFEILSQKQHEVNDAGQHWIELEFTLHHRDVPAPIIVTIRVDSETRLPRSWKTAGELNGRKLILEARFDYPNTGPNDVYALGVPQVAAVVDRLPTDDVARIIEGVRASRQRFDHYHAIVVVSANSQQWFEGEPLQIWRKGNRWRVERPTVYPDATQQPLVNDPPGWWHEQLAKLSSYPIMACDGTTVREFHGEFIEADDPKERRFEVRSVSTLPVMGQKDDPLPVFWSRMPEFLMRPPLGIPREDMEPVLDGKATDGPADTVLVRVRRTRKDAAHIDGVESPDFYRFWIDPSRGYICMRWEMGSNAPPADSELSSYLVEEVSRSPQGHWYPTAVRIKNAIRREDGSKEDQLIRFYLDFAGELPDRLFQSAE